MNRLAKSAAILAAAAFISSCDSHPWSTTQVLFKPHGGGGHGDEHAADAKDAHAPAAGHEVKKDEHGGKPKH